jgi:hypothetical protein
MRISGFGYFAHIIYIIDIKIAKNKKTIDISHEMCFNKLTKTENVSSFDFRLEFTSFSGQKGSKNDYKRCS